MLIIITFYHIWDISYIIYYKRIFFCICLKHFRINTQSIVKTFHILESVSFQTRRRRRGKRRKTVSYFSNFFAIHMSFAFVEWWLRWRWLASNVYKCECNDVTGCKRYPFQETFSKNDNICVYSAKTVSNIFNDKSPLIIR